MFHNDDIDALAYAYMMLGGNGMLRNFNMNYPFGQYVPATSFNKATNDMMNVSQNMYQHGLMIMNAARACCCDTFNNLRMENENGLNILYADNKPIMDLSHYEEKPKTDIFDLDRLIFPEDPIRDWVEKRVAEINAKYAWADKIYI